MCVDCVLALPRIAHVDPGDEPLPEVILSQHPDPIPQPNRGFLKSLLRVQFNFQIGS
jgi:hypothetical protein